MDNNKHQKELLFFKAAEKSASPEEEEILKKLLVSPEEAQEYEMVKQLISIDNQIKSIQEYDLDNGYAKVRQKIRKRNPFLTRFTNKITRFAAILAIPLLISTLALLYFNFNNSAKEISNPIIKVTVPSGSITNFTLPDGSRVWLNAESTLSYPSSFEEDSREVVLEGEGYFQVRSDKKHPFVVSTYEGLKVEAHGTAFNVNAYRDDNLIETTLEEGFVDVFTSENTFAKMKPGDNISFDKKTGKLSKSTAFTGEKTSWKDGKIIFRNASLDEVFKKLERRYNIEIEKHDPHHLAGDYRCRVTFGQETVQQIFSYLEIAAPIKWKMKESRQKNDSTYTKPHIEVWLNK